jgi:hypothetical protein
MNRLCYENRYLLWIAVWPAMARLLNFVRGCSSAGFEVTPTEEERPLRARIVPRLFRPPNL